MNDFAAAVGGRGHTVAYMMSRFPKLTETFVLDEIVQLTRNGWEVKIFPLWREPAELIHDDALSWVAEAQFLPTLSGEIIADNFYWMVRQPKRYFPALGRVVSENISSLRFLAGALAAFPKASTMARRMQMQGVEHVHAHFASHPAAIAYVVNKLTDIPWSFTAHGSDLHRDQAMLEQKVASAKFAVAISQYNRRFILEHCTVIDADKVKVVHCGVDLGNFDTVPPKAQMDSVINIVCIGTLHEVKGQTFLLRACAKIEDTNWQCHLVGDGEDRAKLEALAIQLGIKDRVIFHGQCTRERVREVLNNMTIACAPSVPTRDGRREGIPVALMEAAAAGLALVASDLSGIPELVVHEETGLLTTVADVDDIAQALTRLASDASLRKRLSEACRHKVEREFSLSSNVSALQTLMLEPAA
ncbi:MAG: glycosyltransferase family 4 protein [Pseudomonadaceae bacterium]|nr:glycosyltransferase family 4 protein [Pseudomonadaceae bacterium]